MATSRSAGGFFLRRSRFNVIRDLTYCKLRLYCIAGYIKPCPGVVYVARTRGSQPRKGWFDAPAPVLKREALYGYAGYSL